MCAFANGQVGYLILGADQPTGATEWTVDGVPIEGEPRPAITDAIVDVDGGVPRPDFDIVAVLEAPKGHVVIVEIQPTSTPPCLTNGTVYERLPGKSRWCATHSSSRACTRGATRRSVTLRRVPTEPR